MELLKQQGRENKEQKVKTTQSNPLLSQQWKSEEDYKREIISLELQNQKYRNQLYELGQTVNKILDKVKVSASTNKSKTQNIPNLQQQLQLVKKELHNVNQFIDIYQKQLTVLNAKKKKDQNETLLSTQQILKQKNQQLLTIRKQVKELSHKNKALQYKLLQYSKKGKTKSADQQTLQLKQLITENNNLKSKLQELQNLHSRKQKWLDSNIASAKQLQTQLQLKQIKLPKIQKTSIDQSNSIDKSRSLSSLPKLQSQKKIYTKWLQTVSKQTNQPIDHQLQQLQKINTMMQTKISNTSAEIKNIQQQIAKLKQKISQHQSHNQVKQQKKSINKKPSSQIQKSSKISTYEESSPSKLKKKHVGTMVTKRLRKVRKDWVGKFDGLRFSDSRYVRQEARLYKVLFNTNGYCQFFYYSCRDPKQRFNSKLPFETNNLMNQGKDSSFTVEHPDFIKNIRLKINIKTHRITGLTLVSNLAIEGQFIVDNMLGVGGKAGQKTLISSKQEQPEVNYEMDVKSNQAISCIFGSYGVKLDEKKQVTNVWLQGLGVELIEDFVQQLI